MFKFTVISAALFITTAINIIATVISWHRVKSRFGFYFAMGMTGITFWTLMSGLDYAATPIPLKIFFAKWEYVCYHIALIYFLMFLLFYAGYGSLLENKFVRILLWAVPASNVLLAWTNEWHQWVWSGFVRSQFGDNTLIFQHGPAFLWVAGTGYVLMASIVLTAWLASRRGSEYARRQGRLLFFGSLLPLLGNLIYQFQPLEFDGVDWSSILLSISSLLFLWALYGTNLLDLVPIAREKLIDGLSDGMIVLDLQGRIVDINQSAAQMIDLSLQQLAGRKLEDFLDFAKGLSEKPPEQEIRTELEVGISEKRYFDVLLSPLFEGKTQVVGQLIIFRNITSRKQNELRLLQLTQAVEQSPASVVITDVNGNITYVNPQFTRLTGYTHEEIIGKNPRILKSGQTPIEVYQELWDTIKAGRIWSGEILNRKKNGELYWQRGIISPVLDHDGRILNFIAVKEDVTERKRAQDELQRLAITDPLTGLFNRRHFFEIAEKEFAKSARYHRPLSVILFDIDMFKGVNDTHGHLVGDKVLIQIGNLLHKKERDSDLTARYGGEEFVVLLPETDREGAKSTAERLRKLLEDSPVYSDGKEICFTASFGVSGTSNHKQLKTFDHLISAADQALYEAKRMGRNQVVCHYEEQL
jgi:diguanylate cyclase (GGDEF)-like protein/PAS domain S-box-containing protein